MSGTRKKTTKVLVPLDGSRFGEQAIGAVAQPTGADRREVALLQVVAPGNPAPLLRDESVARRTLETRYRKADAHLDGARTCLGRREYLPGPLCAPAIQRRKSSGARRPWERALLPCRRAVAAASAGPCSGAWPEPWSAARPCRSCWWGRRVPARPR